MKNLWIIILFSWFGVSWCNATAASAETRFGEFKIVSLDGGNGELNVSNQTFHLSNSAADKNGTCFAFQPFLGSGQIVARIRRPTEATGKVGLIFRETTNSKSRCAGIFLDKGNVVFERVANTNEPPIQTVQTNGNAEWLRVTREGTALNGFFSNDGTNWTQIGADTVEMPLEINGGLCLENSSKADFENVRMTSARWTSPTPNAEFKAPVDVSLKIDISSLGSKTNRVEFFHGTRKIGERTAFPYAMTWSNALAGPDLIFAKVKDEFGLEFFTEPAKCQIQLPQAKVKFIGVDSTTQGNWKGKYGTEGFAIADHKTNFPPSIQWEFVGFHDRVWAWLTEEDRAMARIDSEKRIASAWYHPRYLEIHLNLKDGKAHRLAIYFLDWVRNGRVTSVEILDAMTQKVLDTQEISLFSNGKYLVWSITGHVEIRILPIKANSLINALFVDPQLKEK